MSDVRHDFGSSRQNSTPESSGASASTGESTSPSPSPSIGDLAHDTSDYVRAWSTLLACETRLASESAIRLAFAALIVPALALGICIAFDALIVTLLERWLHDWLSCIAITLCLDLLGLCALLIAMRRWWRNLGMPRSRAALKQMLERLA